MKKDLIMAAVALALPLSGSAQVEYEHSQARVQEGVSEFYVRPIVAELQMIETTRKTYGPYTIFPDVSFNEIYDNDIKNAKANAVYRASKEANADVILGTTFHVTASQKQKGIIVEVYGYPAKYVNFHSFGDAVKGKDDDKWVKHLLESDRTRKMTSDDQTKSIETVTRKR